jgi:hypothetical protein
LDIWRIRPAWAGAQYALALLVFNAIGFVAAVYALQRLQAVLPLNPQACRRGAGFGAQHRDQLRHQHQLAGLRRRKPR